jgi:hypothetical protein
MAIQMVISPVVGSNPPQIMFGFHDDTFSQAVYLHVDPDPLKCVEMANHLAETFVASCGAAVKGAKDAVPVTLRGVPDGE